MHEQLTNIAQKYENKRGEYRNFSAFIMGYYSSGKTTLLGTARGPIVIASFDPRNTIVLEQLFKDDIGKRIFIREYWTEDLDNPSAFKRWQQDMREDKRTGLFKEIGTYAIDSMTTWIDAIVTQFCATNGRDGGKLEIQDYQIIYTSVKKGIRHCQNLGCDFLMTAHLIDEKDDKTGRVWAQIDTYNRLRSRVPLLFTEKWLINANKDEFTIITQTVGKTKAGTQIGAKSFKKAGEKADIKYLLKKANYPHEDRTQQNG